MSVFLTFLNKNRQGKMAFLSFQYGWPWGISRDAPPLPSESVRTDGRTDARTLTSKPNFLGLMGYQFFLPMVLHWHASRAEAPLKMCSDKTCNDRVQFQMKYEKLQENTYRLRHRKCDVRIFIHELQNFWKRTSERSERVSFPKFCNKWINPYKALSML